jgi:lipoate-protein ligase A
MAFQFLHLKQLPIFDQLKLEEALLRNDRRNWCIVNQGTPVSIVMGISGKKEELIDLPRARADSIPLIKRFSGGGTVIVDENTLFITFICEKSLHPFSPFPEPIMKWTEQIYRETFPHDAFCLRENDFVIGEKKIGGNAQYIKKDRWLHHTSFLWDYSNARMNYLLHPKKTPLYREGRPHHAFLSRLSDYFSDSQLLIENLKSSLAKRYPLIESTLDDALHACPYPSRQSTCLEI